MPSGDSPKPAGGTCWGAAALRRIEELSMNAWPALQTVFHDGWVLRFADGYTRRANSVNPLYYSTEDVTQKIEKCEHEFDAKGLPVVFKMTTAACPPALDGLLAERGYGDVAPTSVQLLDLAPPAEPLVRAVSVSSVAEEAWLMNYCRLNAVDEGDKPTLRKILGAIVPRSHFVSLHHKGEVIGCGMCVVEGGFVGLFDVVIESSLRNQGFGRLLVLNLLRLGERSGARTAYLQVMGANEPALRLYRDLGFKQAYTYWYRVRRQSRFPRGTPPSAAKSAARGQ
jgi:ribosomal protein S18 acetylase RimI-like enzyme